jgi:NADH-quinone oxidoreductase subunit D
MSDQEQKNLAARISRTDAGRLRGFEGDLHTEPMRLQFGPSHPATHGTVRIVLDLDGERILEADVQVGYLHRGFEKECETGLFYQNIPYTDRLTTVRRC